MAFVNGGFPAVKQGLKKYEVCKAGSHRTFPRKTIMNFVI
jgi:hypothetical protein